MLKHIYKTIILIAVFIASLVYFSRDIKEVVFQIDNTTQMSETTFPVVTLETEGNNINLLHGYAGSMESNLIRDAITPLDSTQSLFVYIDEKESTVKKVNYELRATFDNTLIESGSFSALEKSGDKKVAKIKFTTTLEQGKEYALTITTVTAESKKINFYTRVMLNPSHYLKDKLDYVKLIHNALFDKNTVEAVSQYFEPSKSADNTSLSYVNINSSIDLISFGALEPEVISEVIPTIKEISSDIASIELAYYIKGTTDDGTEIYSVKEFYRVKYTASRMYLLNYERTMESQFDINLFSLSKGEIKLGISKDEAAKLYVGEGNTNLCFVRNGELWYYNLDENKAVRVFSFRQEETDYVRDVYDQHDIKVLNMNVEGTIDFVVYGYMNRGNYEGRVGMILYRYYPSDTRIEELVYIPVSEPYQILKENMGDFAYLTFNDVYYFMLNQTIYSYNIITKGLDELADDIDEDNYVFSKEKMFIAWDELDEDGLARSITVLNLETQTSSSIQADTGENVSLLGMIDNNIIYGTAKDEDVYTTINGDVVVPCYELKIVDQAGAVKKTYNKSNYYITGVTVDENVVNLSRVKKTSEGFQTASADHILNQIVESKETIAITSRVTERALTEHYISLTNGQAIAKKPKVFNALTTIITDETALRLEEADIMEGYYVYAYGGIEGRYMTAGEAITVANEKVGVVMNQNQQLVWARGTRSSKVALEVTPVYAGDGVTSYEACLSMLGQFTKGKKLQMSEAFSSVTLKEDSKRINATLVNMSGASLDEILYFVHKGRPVIAAKNSSQTVLITGYDGTAITVIDPETRVTSKMTMKNAEALFLEAGNVFLSFIE